MLVWLGVIRYLGFFQKYNVRISWDLWAVVSFPLGLTCTECLAEI